MLPVSGGTQDTGTLRLQQRLYSSVFMLFAGIFFWNYSSVSSRNLGPAIPQLAVIAAVALCVNCFAVWSACGPKDTQAFNSSSEASSISLLLFCSILCAVSAWHIDGVSCAVLLKGIASFVVPVLQSREVRGVGMLCFHLITHFVVIACVLRNSLFDDGWQYLVALFLVDVVLLDTAQHNKDLADAAVQQAEQQMSVIAFLQHMTSMICDGNLATNSSGFVMGTDKKAMYLLGVDETTATSFVTSTINISDLIDKPPGGAPVSENNLQQTPFDGTSFSNVAGDTAITPGLKTMRLRSLSDHSWLDCEVYTMAVTTPVQVLPVLLGYSRTLPPAGVNSKWYIMALRVTQEGMDPCGIGGKQPMSMSECTSPPLTPRSMAGQSSAVGDQTHRRPVAGEETWGKTQAVCMGVGVGDYTRVRMIARGSQAIVYEARSSDGERFALKEISLKGIVWQRDFPKQLREADREARILKSLRWASGVIVRLEEAWIHSDFSQACLVMEFLPHTMAQVFTGKRQSGIVVPLENCGRWTTQMVAGLAAIHRQRVLHRDIKPSNILLTEDMSRCKIADLGVSRHMRNEKIVDKDDVSVVSGRLDSVVSFNQPAPSIFSTYTEKPGTKAYSSPEGLIDGGDYGCETDVFSLGCVLLEMLTLEKVPEKNLGVKLAEDLTDSSYDSLIVRPLEEARLLKYTHYSEFEYYADICARMLRKRPQMRASLKDVLASPTLALYVSELSASEPMLQRVLFGEDDHDHRSIISDQSTHRRPNLPTFSLA